MEPRDFHAPRSALLRVYGVSLILAVSVATVLAQASEKQEAAPSTRQLPWQRVLTGDDAKRVKALEKAIGELEKKGQFAEAVAPAREVLAIRQRAQGEDHWETMVARIKIQTWARVAGLPRQDQSDLAAALRQQEEADKFHKGRRYAEAEAPTRKVREVFRRVLGEDHLETATSCNNLAEVLDAQAKHVEAEPFLQQALASWPSALGENHPHKADIYSNLAYNLFVQGKYAEAERHLQQALLIWRRTRGEAHSDTARCYNNLAEVLDAQGKYAEAQPLQQKALTILRVTLGEDDASTAFGFNSLAMNLGAQGKYAEAEPLLRKALTILRALDERHPDTAVSYNSLATILEAQGKYADAEPLYQQALEIHCRALGEDHPYTAVYSNNLASNLNAQGKYAGAEPLLQKALRLRRALGEEHFHTATIYHNLAISLSGQGQYAEAEKLYQKALKIYGRTLGEDHPFTAGDSHTLAMNLQAQGKSPEAEAMALAAARSYEAARLRASFTGLDRAEFSSKSSPLPLLAAILARRGRDQDAWQRWESSLARGLFDDLAARRRSLTPDERRREEDLVGQLNQLDNQIGALTGPTVLTKELGQRLVSLQNRRLESQGRLAELKAELVRKYGVAAGAVYDLHRIQTRLPADAALVGWLDLKTMPQAVDPRGDHWACVVRHRGAPRWVRIPGTGPDQAWTPADDQQPGQVRALLGRRDAPPCQSSLSAMAAQRLAPLEPALGARDDLPAVRHLIVLPSPALAGVPVEGMLAARPPRAASYLVSYAPSGTLFAWLQEQDRRQDQAHDRRLLALGDPMPPPLDEPTPAPPDHGLLVQQVQPGSHAEQAGIQPGDVLLRYAGAKLTTRDDLQKQLQAGDPKAQSVAIALWRNGATLDRTLAPGPPGVVLNDRPAAQAILAQREADALLRRSRGATFERLPGTRREVQALAGLFGQSAIHLGSDASEQTLEALRAKGQLGTFAVIHLATHGQIDDLAPMNSRLLLAQDRLPDPTAALPLDGPIADGLLTAGEVMSAWKLNAELVTLSACQSGLGRQSGGEGFIGFAQAFFLAGSRSLVVSLWEVNDQATSLLMTRFYQNWLGKRPGLDRPQSKAEALREAKEWLRGLDGAEVERELDPLARGELQRRSGPRPVASRPFAHPHYWAGFILMGDPN